MTFAILFLVVGSLLNQALCHRCVDKPSHAGIIGGHTIPIERAPYMVSLRRNGFLPEDAHFCGGSIIHKRFILTAAHCVQHKSDIKVLVGTDNNNGEDGELFDIEEIIVHNNFNNITGDYDLALIKLKEPLTFGPKVAKINLPSPLETLLTPPGTKLNATGWGQTENTTSPSKLRQVEIPLVDQHKCKEMYDVMNNYNITSNMICAGSPGHQAFYGDSGGPLTLDDVQFGVVSYGACPDKLPGVFTDVSSITCWILEKIIPMLK